MKVANKQSPCDKSMRGYGPTGYVSPTLDSSDLAITIAHELARYLAATPEQHNQIYRIIYKHIYAKAMGFA